MKSIFLLLFSIMLLFSCDSKEDILTKTVEENLVEKPKTRYTFSQYKNVDFGISSSSYQILYDFSVPIDTFFAYSGAYLCGVDSIIYVQIRKEFDENLVDSGSYGGKTTDLIIYNGSLFSKISPPLFHPHFSSFYVYGKVIYYWGFEDFESLYACSFDLNNKNFKKIKISKPLETDFFGMYEPPFIKDKSKIVFELDRNSYWILNPELTKILDSKITISTLEYSQPENMDSSRIE